jgi:ribosome biogenesis protein NSA1
VANGLGQVEAFDFRAGRFCGAVKGIAGSVRTLALHPDRPVLLSAGLDRFLRLHDTATRRPLGKVYLKSQLTGAQFCPTDASMAAPPPEEEEGAAARGEGRREAAGKRKEERGGGGGGKRRPKERR